MTPLELVIKAKADTDKAFKQVSDSLQKTSQEAEKANKSTEAFGKQLQSTTARAGAFANAVSATSTTLARSAGTLGLPTAALRALDDVADVAALGLGNLSKATVGLDAATAGAAGAGLALGLTIGNLLLKIPGVTEAADAAAAALYKMFTGAGQVAGEAAAAAANWAIEAKKVAAANEALLRSQTSGMTAAQAQAFLFPMPPKGYKELIVEEKKAREEKTEKAIALALKEAIAFDAANRKAEADLKASLERQERDKKAFSDAVIKESWRIEKEIAASLQAITEKTTQAILQQHLAYVAWLEERKRGEQELAELSNQRIEEGWEREREQILENMDAIRAATDLLIDFGLSSNSALVKVLDGWTAGTAAAVQFEKATTLAGKAMAAMNAAASAFNSGSILGGAASGAAFGAQFGIIGAGIGALAGGLLGLFGKAKKAREEMKKLSDQFVQSQGGMAALTAKAKEAGISLDAMFKAKSAAQLQAAIAAITGQLDIWQQSQDGVREAAERYGLTISELGPKFAQQELDKMALQLVKDYELLKASGADMVAVIAKMGPEFGKYVDQVVAAGGSIPKSMKPVIDQLYEEGRLVHENGEAYTEAEFNALKYGETQSEMFERQLELIQRMVDALERMAGINPTINIHTNHTSSGDPGGNGGGHHGGGGGGHPENAYGGFYQQPTLAWMAEGGPAKQGGEFALPKPMLQAMLNAAASAGAAMHRGGDVWLDMERVGRVVSNGSRQGRVGTHPNSMRRGRW